VGGRIHAGSYRLAWSDEFDGAPGTPADRGTWRAETGGSGWGNQELQYYTDEPGNAALDGAGNLAIMARRVNAELGRQRYGGCGYTSARLISRDRVSFRYGLIQARIKIPRARGVWPALWMLGQDIGQSGWPGCDEIDVMEHFGTGPATVTRNRPRAGILRAARRQRVACGRPVARPRLPRLLGRLGPRQDLVVCQQ
jgi:beta-glucanase (GH16 family)